MLPWAGRIVVADAGPLIALGRLDLISLLGSLFAQVQVPEAVLREVLADPTRPDARRLEAAVAAGLLQPCAATPVSAPQLGAGECAAIGRALEIGAALLADDRAARLHATGLGLIVIGTLGVLVQAKREGLLAQVRPQIDRLRASGQRLSQQAVAAALAAAGEDTGR